MKTKLVLALVATLSAGIVLSLWKRAAGPPTTHSPFERAALEQIAQSSRESPANETIAAREIRAQPQVQTHTATVTEDLLVQIQTVLGSSTFDDDEIVFTNLLAELVRTDPLAAAQFAETNSIGDTHDQLLHRVAQLWAATDSSAALNWATTLNNPAERDSLLTEVCLQVAESDPAAAVRMRSQLVTDEKPNEGLEAVLQRWAEKDFSAALNWALSRAAGEQRDLLIARLASVQSQTSPFEAATLVVEQIPAGRVQTEAAIAVLNAWASLDVPAAGQWAARFPEGDLRARAYSELGSMARIKSARQ
jgi:hypothetical protein